MRGPRATTCVAAHSAGLRVETALSGCRDGCAGIGMVGARALGGAGRALDFWLFLAVHGPSRGSGAAAGRAARRALVGVAPETAKVGVVIVLAACVDYGFLRGNIAGRLADVSVPMAILSAWMIGRLTGIVRSGRVDVFGRQSPVGGVGRALAGTVIGVPMVITATRPRSPLRGRARETGA